MSFLYQFFTRRGLWIFPILILSACAGQPPAGLTTIPATPGVISDIPVPASPTIFHPQSTQVSEITTTATSRPEITSPAAKRLFNGIPQGLTEAGFPYLGNPDATVTLIDYSDFL